jgi:hypothetical protein
VQTTKSSNTTSKACPRRAFGPVIAGTALLIAIACSADVQAGFAFGGASSGAETVITLGQAASPQSVAAAFDFSSSIAAGGVSSVQRRRKTASWPGLPVAQPKPGQDRLLFADFQLSQGSTGGAGASSSGSVGSSTMAAVAHTGGHEFDLHRHSALPGESKLIVPEPPGSSLLRPPQV